MRRILATVLVLAALGGYALLAGGASDANSKLPSYWVELDNAFGVIPGADFKIAGVRAGKITQMKVDKRTHHALVGFQITVPGFVLKTDVTCESRPQSLIGEYFVDCQPGRNATTLAPGSTIPVSRTFSTIPADLVQNILRLPQRERLRIILTELGAGVAARGEDLNVVLRRAVPALRETDSLLDLLANESQTLEDLTVNADIVVSALAGNRRQLSRFIREARDTSAASADRQQAIRQSFRLLPGFLHELRPTMVDLGQVADEQIPTLRDLDAASGNLKAFLDQLGPFSDASRPSLATLGDTAVQGSEAVPPALKTVDELNNFTGDTKEVAHNLAIVLDDLRDPDRAVEQDPRAPHPQGYNGFEALLRYVWAQSQAINIFDQNGYILKVAIGSEGECNEYHNAESVKGDQALQETCNSQLGPTQPGINAPDTSEKKPTTGGNNNLAVINRANNEADVLSGAQNAAGPPPQPGSAPAQPPAPTKPGINIVKSLKALVPDGGGTAESASAVNQRRDQTTNEFLDYLLS
jgi:ABC-type transporter Mla subunit MlaD